MDAFVAMASEFGVWTLVAIAVAALVTSTIHGTVGVAGGFLMTAALSLLIGVRPVVPVMSIALVVSHGARSLMNVPDFDRRVFLAIMLPAIPMILIGGVIYAVLPVNYVALVLGIIILSSIPLRHWARARKIEASNRTLAGVGAAYGTLAGASIGSAMLLSPFMLGAGLTKEAFVATMAVISLATNLARIAAFGGADLLTGDYVLLGLAVGVVMIPGNWIGRTFLRRMAPGTHSLLIDLFALVGGVNFLWLAWAGWSD